MGGWSVKGTSGGQVKQNAHEKATQNGQGRHPTPLTATAPPFPSTPASTWSDDETPKESISPPPTLHHPPTWSGVRMSEKSTTPSGLKARHGCSVISTWAEEEARG